MRRVNICGIEHKVVEIKDGFNVDLHLGQIDYDACLIKINADLPPQLKSMTLCHEILHGILIHIGRQDLNQDEQFVTALGTAINTSFNVKEIQDASQES